MDTETADSHPDDPLPSVLEPVVDSDTPPLSPFLRLAPLTPILNVPYLPSLNQRELDLIVRVRAEFLALGYRVLQSFGVVSLLALLLFSWPLTSTRVWWVLYSLLYAFVGWACFVQYLPVLVALLTAELGAKEGYTRGHAIIIVTSLAFFGLIAWCYCTVSKLGNVDWWLASYNINGTAKLLYCQTCTSRSIAPIFQTWYTGTNPQAPVQCQARVRPEQALLFNDAIYRRQFARMYQTFTHDYGKEFLSEGNAIIRVFKALNTSAFEAIQNDLSICGTGILGNADLYGLGIRVGIYLQWLSCLLANNFLCDRRQDTQKVYLVFHLTLCLATLITTLINSCVFSIEVEILYWLYWGGYIIVFSSAPCAIRLGRASQWVKLDWTTITIFFTHWIMAYHAIWFMLQGYDQSFARLPCGTYHFAIAPLLDPSQSYWMLRDWLTLVSIPVIPFILGIFPLLVALTLPEAKDAIKSSSLYQNTFGCFPQHDLYQHVQLLSHTRPLILLIGLLRSVSRHVKNAYEMFREAFGLPGQHQAGIRLITPIHIKERRTLRIRWALTGAIMYILAILAVELILRYNRVQEVYTISATGQYLALIIGVANFSSVLYSISKQEGDRRRKMRQESRDFGDPDSHELQTLSNPISHAFTQPDQEFLMSGALLPNHNDDSVDLGTISSANLGIVLSDQDVS